MLQTSKKQSWFGIDASNEISLFEYGLLVKQDAKDSYTVIYKVSENTFDTATITNVECNYLTKESWFDLAGFLSYVGSNADSWYSSNIAIRLFDLLTYYGYENIFGSCWYGGMSEDEARQQTGL